MKIYYIITNSQRVLEQEHFLPTAQAHLSDTTFHPIEFKPKKEQIGNFWDQDYFDTLIFRSHAVLDLIEKHWEDYFVLSDVDIVVVKDFVPFIKDAIIDYDILHQRDGFGNIEFVNGGFTVIKCNEKTKEFYKHVLDQTVNSNDPKYLDQDAIKDYYYKLNNPYGLKWQYLPCEKFATRYEFHNLEASKDQLMMFHSTNTMPRPDWTSVDQKRHYLTEFVAWHADKRGRFY